MFLLNDCTMTSIELLKFNSIEVAAEEVELVQRKARRDSSMVLNPTKLVRRRG